MAQCIPSLFNTVQTRKNVPLWKARLRSLRLVWQSNRLLLPHRRIRTVSHDRWISGYLQQNGSDCIKYFSPGTIILLFRQGWRGSWGIPGPNSNWGSVPIVQRKQRKLKENWHNLHNWVSHSCIDKGFIKVGFEPRAVCSTRLVGLQRCIWNRDGYQAHILNKKISNFEWRRRRTWRGW